MLIFMNGFEKSLIVFGLCYIFYIFGLVVFMNGLVSPSTVNLQPSSTENLKNCPQIISNDICNYQRNLHNAFYSNHYKRVIIIVIDALRADFIPSIKFNPKFSVTMKFTEQLLKNGSAISFVSQGFAPTVTLPRIKTLVTGTVSNFVDIIMNFNADKLSDDNLLQQATLFGLKSVFYGDDTWLKLFPNLFIRSEGTHSFFVSDFKEVDYNVSRHIKTELNNKDWNIMILHFLGVDHIGHAYGPFSEYLPPKLNEMDQIVKLAYENLKNDQSPSLIIVCGDHGMTTSGSHGGTTQDELLTPLIFITTADAQVSPKKSSTVIDQVDFAPTLSAILGLPIPINNFGKIIPDILEFIGFSPEQMLYASFFNFLQLSKIYKKAVLSEAKNISFATETIESHFNMLKFNDKINLMPNNSMYIHLLKSYQSLLGDMKQDLLSMISGYNEILTLVGLLIIWTSFIFTFYSLLFLNSDKNIFNIYTRKLTIMSYLLIVITIIICLYCKIHLEFIPLIILFLFIFQIIFALVKSLNECSSTKLAAINITFLFVHALSLFSSSYIEEEHQTWYYFSTTIITLICCSRLYHLLNLELKGTNAICIYDLWRIWTKYSSTVYTMFAVLISHRIFRKWNQVGNKWQYLPDLSDWLNNKENIAFLVLSILISQLIIIVYFRKGNFSQNYFLFSLGIVCVTFQKLGNSTYLPLSVYMKTILIPWFVYVLIFIIVISAFIRAHLSTLSSSKKIQDFLLNFVFAWILLIEIIARTHNIPLIAVALIQEYLLSTITWKNVDIIISAICYLIMAMTHFSYYGNSNSLSTIDVFTGYTGIQSYLPFVIGFLLACNTYSTIILWLLMIPYRIIQLQSCEDVKNIARRINVVFLCFLDYKLFILALYCIVMHLMRHHLFIFSVFFPKLLYEMCNVILFSVIYFLIIFIINRG